MLEVGTQIYDFKLKDSLGNDVSLNQFKGKKIVIYFYPKDSTPGCTKQACSFRNEYSEFSKYDTIVIGISKDSVASHLNFSNKNNLPFILLSDETLEVINYFGVWQEKTNYGKKYFGVVRTTFVLDENHKLIKVFKNVKPESNASQVLEFIKTI